MAEDFNIDKELEDLRKGGIPFNPEGKDYDYRSAVKFGLKPDKTGHWPSRDPKSGMLLKGRKHPTWSKTVEGEASAGFEIFQENGRYYSRPKRKPNPTSRADILSGYFKK